MRKTIAVAVAALFLATAAAGPAEAHTKKFPSEVTIDNLPPTAGIVEGSGRVLSQRTECYVGRTVTLYDTRFSAPLAELQTEYESDGVGRWIRPGPYENGVRYRAVIAPLTFKRTARHKHRCAGDDAEYTGTSS